MRQKKQSNKARNPTQQMNLPTTNTGYSEGSASVTKGTLAAYRPIKSSAKSDINANLPIMRNRSNDQAINTPIGASAVNTSRTNVIGAGLKLFPRIRYKLLNMDVEDSLAWNKRVAEEFDLWASSKFCDLYRKNNFYDLQDIAYLTYLIDGDSFVVFRRKSPNAAVPYSLRLQLFEANRVSNPYAASSMIGIESPFLVETINPANKNRIISGVEIDGDGAVTAYWVSNKVPYDPYDLSQITRWARVEAFGEKTGQPNILQISHDERPEQYRGVPYLAPVIETLKQVSRYTDAELTAAIIKSFFTLFFVEQTPGAGLDAALAETFRQQNKVALDPSIYELGPGTLNTLPPGYDVKSMDASRTLSTFEPFTNQLIRQVAAAIEQPYEVVMKSFNSSYSASRAALLQAWAHYKMRRIWFTRDFCQPIYETWLAEAIAIGRVDAPGFFDDPLIRKAWSNAEWYGPVMGMLDPVKDATGANLRREYGLSTGEREAAETTGTDIFENFDQLALEKRMAEKAGITIGAQQVADTTEKEGSDDDDETVLDNKKSGK